MIAVYVVIASICWGSFLNVLAHRLLTNESMWFRSHCPRCKTTLRWYHLIPVFSYLFLNGECRFCEKPISPLYPLIESLAGLLGYGVYWLVTVHHLPLHCLPMVVLFLSGLLVTIRTDLQAMVIPQLATVWLIPVALIGGYFGCLPTTFLGSVIGAIIGYGLLMVVAVLFKRLAGREGLGQGDIDLMGMIGAFLGPIGVWAALFFGSLSGLVIGGLYMYFFKKGRDTRIPFAPFLSLGALLYFYFPTWFIERLFS